MGHASIDFHRGRVIDLESLRPHERLPYWNEVISANYCVCDAVVGVRQEEHRARLERWDLGALEFARIASTPVSAQRDCDAIRRGPEDSFVFSILSSGGARLEQNGRQVVQRVGEILMYDTARPFTYAMPGEYAGTWLRVPRHLVMHRMGKAEALTARRIPTATPVGALAARLIDDAYDLAGSMNPTDEARVAMSILDVIAVAFETGAGSDVGGNARRTNLLDRVKAYILAHLDDPDLSIHGVIAKNGVSLRTLHRLFAEEGTTAARWIWQKRLERGKSMLEGSCEIRITEVALSCGFRDLSHFSRTFKAEFGLAPRMMAASQRLKAQQLQPVRTASEGLEAS